MSRNAFILPLPFLFAIACGDPSSLPEPEDTPRDLSSPLRAALQNDHGALSFEEPLALTLEHATAQHVFHFTLSASARVELDTFADASGALIDTVLTLEREGSTRVLARDDDGGDKRFSRLVRDLAAGSYRVRVSGFSRAVQGDFLFEAHCAGQGCPPPPLRCLFGDTFYALRTEGPLTILDEHWLRTIDGLSALEGQQLVIAVQQSSHTDVTTPAEALAAVDQNEVRRMRLADPNSAREYDVFEYGAGDNSYGAIFRADSTFKAASIHDGDLMECTEL